MNLDNLDFEQMPADAGQIVSVEYAVDWESDTLYRRTADRSRPSSGTAMHEARITGGEFDPQNGTLPEHGEWTPADEATAATDGRGMHYRSAEWQRLAAFVQWQGIWPVIDANGDLTGDISEGCESELNVEDEAMIDADDARAGGWRIDAEEGHAYPPTREQAAADDDEALAVAGLVCGRNVEEDASGGQGHCWRLVRGDEMPASIRAEIEAEMIDGGVDSSDDYMASNGCHYRW